MFDAVADDDSGDDVVGEGRKNASRARSSRDDDVFALTKRESKKASKRRAQHSADDPETAKERADLELLMMDEKQLLGKSDGVTEKMSSKNDTDEPKKKKSKKERLAEKRRLRGKAARRAESDEEDDGEANKLDITDDRFGGV